MDDLAADPCGTRLPGQCELFAGQLEHCLVFTIECTSAGGQADTDRYDRRDGGGGVGDPPGANRLFESLGQLHGRLEIGRREQAGERLVVEAENEVART